MFKLYCNKNDAFFQETAILTSGRVGEQISFTFSPDWDGLLKTAVFIAGKTSKDVVLTEDNCNIPPEVLVFPGEHLRVGVFGETADKTLVIPTIYASAGTIRPGASPSGMTSSPPSPSWTEQVHAIALEAKEVADSVRDDADAGKFNGPAGGWYTPAVTQPDANTMRVSFSPSKEGMPAVAETDITLPAGGGSGGSGEDGGYYTPAVTQTTENTMQVVFTPSKTTMPAVDGTEITLPAGPQGSAGADGADGADGKSAYAYAVEGGFTGTEAEFSAKLAQEIPKTLPNPNALTFTGAVTGSYDGSEPLSVEIPSGGGSGGGNPLYVNGGTTLAEGTIPSGLAQYTFTDTGLKLYEVLQEWKIFFIQVYCAGEVNEIECYAYKNNNEPRFSHGKNCNYALSIFEGVTKDSVKFMFFGTGVGNYWDVYSPAGSISSHNANSVSTLAIKHIPPDAGLYLRNYGKATSHDYLWKVTGLVKWGK